MALLHPFNFFAAHPFTGAWADGLHHMYSFDEPDVIETDNGFLISAHVPGVNAADIAIKASARPGESSATLSIKGKGDVDHTFRLPTASADLANITASCIDGILRVAVRKVPVTEHSVPIAAALPAPGTDDDGNSDNKFTLHVPGFAPSDISVVFKSTGKLVVEGKSDRRGCFKKHFSLDRTMTPDRISASCADGLLHISIASTAKDVELSVPVAAKEDPVAMEGDEHDTPYARVTLIRQPVPGFGAKDITVTVKDGVVNVSGKADQSAGARCRFHRVSLQASLPAGAETASVAASCEHGMLTVTCGAPPAPAEVEVAVSADRLACLGAEHEEDNGKEPAKE